MSKNSSLRRLLGSFPSRGPPWFQSIPWPVWALAGILGFGFLVGFATRTGAAAKSGMKVSKPELWISFFVDTALLGIVKLSSAIFIGLIQSVPQAATQLGDSVTQALVPGATHTDPTTGQTQSNLPAWYGPLEAGVVGLSGYAVWLAFLA